MKSLLTYGLLGSTLLAALLFMLFVPGLTQAEQPPDIDSFNTDQAQLWLMAPEDTGTSAASTVSDPDILGGERDLEIKLVEGDTDSTSLAAEVVGTVFYLASGPGIAGSARIEWDGPDGDPTSLDPTGLGGIDLTNGGTQDAFQFRVMSDDWPVAPIFTVYTDADNFSTFTLNLPGQITPSGVDFMIPYGDFTAETGTGADFTNVGAVTLFIPATLDLDLRIESFDTTRLLAATQAARLLGDNDGDGQAGPGDTLQYTVNLTNPEDAFAAQVAGVVFSDTLDLNTTLVVSSVTTTQGTVTSGNGTGDTAVEVDIGSLADGSQATVTFEAAINKPLPAGVTEVTNQGFVSSDILTNLPTDDPDTGATDDPTITPVFSPVLNATKVDALQVDNDGDGQVDPGDTLAYTISITNSGQVVATGVVFSDTLDLNTTLVVSSVTTTQGTVASGNGTGDTNVEVDIGSLTSAGSQVTVTFEATVNDPLPGGVTEVINQGTVSGDNFFAVLTNETRTSVSP